MTLLTLREYKSSGLGDGADRYQYIGKGQHDAAPRVSDFIETIFGQLKNGSNELSFGTRIFSFY